MLNSIYPLLVLIYHYIMLFFDFIINFVLNSTLFYMSIVSPDFFPVTFAWNMFPSLNFQSVFFLNPFSHLCLFVGAFSPLTFK